MLCNLECGASITGLFCPAKGGGARDGDYEASSSAASGAAVISPAAAKKVNDRIEDQLIQEAILMQKTLKILLLGGAESGKSTIFKQMRILHMQGFTETDLLNYRFLVHANTIQSMRELLEGVDLLAVRLRPHEERDAQDFKALGEAEKEGYAELDRERAALLLRLWESPPVQSAYRRRGEFRLLDSAKYFLENVERMGRPDYKPSDQDILRSRVATTGINEITFDYRKAVLRLVDVGGQKSEQRKWIHCFDSVNGILFITDLAGYDQVVADDPDKGNKLHDSMAIFERLLKSGFFNKTAMILFMNKSDTRLKVDKFREKLEESPLTEAFPEFAGPQTYEAAQGEILGHFESIYHGAGRTGSPYVHWTVATDTSLVDKVFETGMDVVFRENMGKIGFV